MSLIQGFHHKMVLLFTGTSVTQGWIFTFASHSGVLRMVEGGPISDDCHHSSRTGHFTTHSLTWESLSYAKSLCHVSGFEWNYEGCLKVLHILAVILGGRGVRRLVEVYSLIKKVGVILRGELMRLKALTSNEHLSGVWRHPWSTAIRDCNWHPNSRELRKSLKAGKLRLLSNSTAHFWNAVISCSINMNERRLTWSIQKAAFVETQVAETCAKGGWAGTSSCPRAKQCRSCTQGERVGAGILWTYCVGQWWGNSLYLVGDKTPGRWQVLAPPQLISLWLAEDHTKSALTSGRKLLSYDSFLCLQACLCFPN